MLTNESEKNLTMYFLRGYKKMENYVTYLKTLLSVFLSKIMKIKALELI